jgi:hypothetical protein
MKLKIYGYYESLQTRPQSEEFARANYWKQSWEKHGWDPVILNNSHAKGSPLYQKLVAKLLLVSKKLSAADQNNFQSILVRFTRWCALHAAHGGWMSHYDVLNCGFTPLDAEKLAKNQTLVLIGNSKPFLMFANTELCFSAISKFISEDLNENGDIKREQEILNTPIANIDLNLFFHVDDPFEKKKSELMRNFFEKKT